MIKAIFFDIDGTSFSHKTHGIPTSAMTAFKKLKANGYRLGICTSRSLEEMKELPDPFIDMMDAVVCIAGAQIYERGTCISYHSLNQAEVSKIIAFMEAHQITFRWVSCENENFLNHQDKEIEDRFYTLYQMIPGIKAYEGQTLVHILYYTHDETLRGQIADMCQKNYHISLHYASEILAPNVNKGHGIMECANHWGLHESEIAAFGDGLNDIEMINAAEIGIAMGNAQAPVKAVADYVTTDIDEDGIYNACIHFGWIKETVE